jgi:GNAT superfamily N-acetyltransferase
MSEVGCTTSQNMQSVRLAAEANVSGIQIGPARFEDLAAIVHLLAEDDLGGHGDAWSPQSIPHYEAAMRAILDNSGEELFVARDSSNGDLIGTFQMSFAPTLRDLGAMRCILQGVHVAAARRGCGIGRAMIGAAEARAVERGAKTMALTSNKQRHDAHRFYQSLGYLQSHQGFKKRLGPG